MKSKFNTLAPILALILLASAGSAWKYGKEFEERGKAAKMAEALAKTDMEVAEIAMSEVMSLPEAAKRNTGGKNAELAEGIAALMTIAKSNGIKIASLVGAAPGATGVKPIESVFSAVPLTNGQLFKADVVIKAEYQSYDGFRRFFDEVRERGMAVQSVTVRRSNFEATVRFIGT